ncbi:MAG TPA: hypothetical protein VNT60_07720 [Deinococcales bacterium]|nr:hypothetical protein [Deinococcales bacterium]
MPRNEKRRQLTRLSNASKRMEAHAAQPQGEQSTAYKRALDSHDRARRALEALGVNPSEAGQSKQ